MNRRMKENIAGYAFVTPALVVFLTFVAVPFLSSLLLSVTEWNFLSGLSGIKFVGTKNFVRLFTRDKDFKHAIVNTFIYSISTVPTSIAVALILAYILHGNVKGKKILRLAFFIPYISSTVALAAVFKFMFRDDGVVNSILIDVFGMKEGLKWLADGALNRIPIILLIIWTSIGYCLIIYMAALQNVPRELLEASELDGAVGFRQFIHVTFPLISPTTFYLVVVRLIASFKVFASINIMTMGSSARQTTSLVNEIYGKAFSSYKFGYASAEAVVLFVIILIITRINFWAQKKWVHY